MSLNAYLKTETPQPKSGRISARPSRRSRFKSAAILLLYLLFCQYLPAQSPDMVRETVLRLRELGDCRQRVEELSRDNASLLSLCEELRAKTEALHQREVELVRREKDLEIAAVQARVRELEQTVTAWETRSREQDELIKMLTQRRRWWCLWLCKK